MTTWTSLRRPLAKVGRSGRSISRQVRIASSDGRPSRRKNEPGMRPAAYMRSSTSTVSGKKSKCSLGWRPAVVAESSMVSPMVTTTEPAAWRASRPVSKVTLRLPKLPLSMTAVAVVTPSSGSNSAVMLPVVVGADTCPSLCSSHRASCRGATSSWVAAVHAVRGGRGRPVFDRSPRAVRFPVGGGPTLQNRSVPGATTEDRPVAARVGRVLPVARAAGAARVRGPSRNSGSGPLDVLAAQTEPLDERAVPRDVGLRQVVEQPPTAADQQEQAPPAVVVVLVHLEVLGEVADPAGQHRDLDLGRAGVVLDRGVFGHDLLLQRALERHRSPPGAGHVWPPVCVTGAALTHVDRTIDGSQATSGEGAALRAVRAAPAGPAS